MNRWYAFVVLMLIGMPLFAQELAFDTMGNLYVQGEFEVPNDSSLDYMDLMMKALAHEKAVYNNAKWRFKKVSSEGKVIVKLEDYELYCPNWQGKLIFTIELRLETFNNSDEPYGKPVNLFKWETRRFERLLYEEAEQFSVQREIYRKLPENDQTTLRELAPVVSQGFVNRVKDHMYEHISGRPSCCQHH